MFATHSQSIYYDLNPQVKNRRFMSLNMKFSFWIAAKVSALNHKKWGSKEDCSITNNTNENKNENTTLQNSAAGCVRIGERHGGSSAKLGTRSIGAWIQ